MNILEKIESFPAMIQFDYSEKSSNVQGVIEQGCLTICHATMWRVGYYLGNHSDSIVEKMDSWLTANEQNYKVL